MEVHLELEWEMESPDRVASEAGAGFTARAK